MSRSRRRHGRPWLAVLGSLLLTVGLFQPGPVVAAADLAPAGGGADRPAAVDPARAGGRVDMGRTPLLEPVSRVIVTWSADAGPRVIRSRRLSAAAPGMRPATWMTARSEAYWLARPLRGFALRRHLQQLAAQPGVQLVEPDRLLHADLVPDDPRYTTNQWHLRGTYGVQAPAAWDVTTGSSSVVVAVIDTGYTVHTEMDTRILPGYDFISDSRIANDGGGVDSNPADPGDWVTSAEALSGFFLGCRVGNSSWHGTHVNGIVAAKGNNATGVAGVSWNTSILPVRVLGKCGGYTSDIANGIRWAAGGTVSGVPVNPNPAKVINMSLGGTGACSTTVQSAIDDAYGRGTLIVVAAGNETDLAVNHNPANCNNVVTVASTDSAGKRSSFSNHGVVVDIAAPGSSIDSTLNSGTQGPSTQSYAIYSGTSMATPHVAGIAALLLAVDPTLTPAQLTTLLTANVTPFAADGTTMSCQTVGCGAGIANAASAVTAASATAAPAITKLALQPASDLGSSSSDLLTSATSLTYDLVFSKPVTDVTGADLSLTGTATGCSVSAPAGSGTTYTVAVTGCSAGTVTLTFAQDGAVAANTLTGPAAARAAATVTIDRTAPAAPTITTVTGSPTAATSIAFTVAFGETVNGIAAADFTNAGTATGCTFSPSAASGSSITLTVTTCAAPGTLRPRLLAAGVADAAGNPGPAADADAAATLTLDRVGPAVTGFSSLVTSPTATTSIAYTLTLDESASGIVAADFTNAGIATGCAFSPSASSGTSVTVTVTGCSATGTLQPRLLAGSVTDMLGNAGPAADATATTTLTLDRVAPTVTGFTTAVTSPTNATSIAFTLTFSEAVSGLAAGDLVNAGSLTGCTFTPSASAGTTLTITVTTCSVAGTLQPRLLAGSVTDAAGNTGPVADADAAATIDVSRVPPAVSSFSSTAASPTNATSIDFDLVIGTAVTGLAVGDLSNAGTATGCVFTPDSSAGSTFTITVTDCSATGTLRPRLTAGAVTDAVGNAGPAAAVDATTTLTLDRVAPAVTAFSSAVGSPTNATSIGFTLTFDEAISGLAAGDLSNAGSATGCAFAPSASAGTSFTVTVTGCAATGTLLPRLAAGAVADAAGNTGSAAATDATTTLTLDRVALTVVMLDLQAGSDTGTSSTDRRTNAATLVFDLGFSEAVSGLTAGDLGVTGSATGCSVGTPAGGPTTWSVSVTGCGQGTVTLTVGAGAADDVAGNAGPTASASAPAVTIDRTAPGGVTIASDSGAAVENSALTFSVTADEALDCATLTAADLAVSDGTIGAITDAGAGCDVAVTSSVGEGALGVTSLTASGAFGVADVSGNVASAATGTPAVTVDRRGPDTVAPTASGVVLDPASAAPGASVGVTAAASDDRLLASAQVRIGGGAWHAAAAADGAFDEATEGITGSVTAPAGDTFQVCVRVTDAAGHTSDPVCVTLQVSGAAGVAAGAAFTCAALADGTARCFGANDQGQLGDGGTAPSALPVVVRTAADTPLTGVTAIAAGTAHACAVLTTGRVACWGDNAYGKLGDGTTTDHRFATLVPGLTAVTAITAGTDHTCALRSDATVRCWGRNGAGRLGDGTTTTRRTPVAVSGMTNAAVIAAGGQHTCARLTTGKVRCWGLNADGQLGDGTRTNRLTSVLVTGVTGATMIAAGASHTCVRLSTKVLRCWGDNAVGQLGDGTLVDRLTAVAVSSINTASGIAAGARQTCAVLADGSLRCWGFNADGQLGDGTTTTRKAPVTVAGLAGRTVLSATTAGGHTCARLASGGVVCWGANASGELGDGSTTPRVTPSRVRKLLGDARGQVTIAPEPTAKPAPDLTRKPAPDPTAEPARAAPTPAPTPQPEPPAAPTPDPSPEPAPAA